MSDENSRKRLGRGLAALMGDLDQPLESVTISDPVSSGAPAPGRGERSVPIEQIRANPNNPRRHFSDVELTDLSNSIKEHGIVKPILVRHAREEDPRGAAFEIIAGERRWRAAQKAGLHDVPIIIRDVEDKQALELAIIENVQRADLNAVEEAAGYQQLIDEHDYSQHELAQVIGKSRSHVANTLRLLKLPKSIQALVEDGSLSAGHARALVTSENPEALASKIVSQGLSVRQAENLAAGSAGRETSKPKTEAKQKSTDVLALEKRLEDHLGLKVDLRHGEKDKGEIRIRYKSLEQLEDVCRRLEGGL